jgi:hypothetical protein
MLRYTTTVDVDWQCGDLLEVRLLHVKLCETIMFIHLFHGAELKVQIIYRRMKNGNVLVSELVKDVGESIVANTNYRISVQTQENYGKPASG